MIRRTSKAKKLPKLDLEEMTLIEKPSFKEVSRNRNKHSSSIT
jgi:hypothetical protein